MRSKNFLIALGLITAFQVSAEPAPSEKNDFTLEIAAGMVSSNCRKNGLTSVRVGMEDIIIMGMKKTGLSKAEVIKIIQQPETVMRAGDEASRLTSEIMQRRLTCDDVVAYVIGSSM